MTPLTAATFGLGVVLVVVACDTAPKSRPPARAGGAAAMAPDSMMQRLDSIDSVRRSDSAKATKPPVRRIPADGRLRDSAFGPRFEVDSTGTVRPITPRKKP